ncbi:MAG: NAD(+)/NADH kinase [Candidatus Parcubacteria bacterium]|nr:NAD(+)/NADH kinase [Burkholderiales bacterium]
MPPAFKRVALVGKQTPEIAQSLRALRELLRRSGCEVMLERDTAAGVGENGDVKDYEEIGRSADLAIVVGGDGTMLAAARNLARHKVPLAGINQGRLGFMTDIALSEMADSVGAILEGRHTIEERALIDAEVLRGGSTLMRTVALNEAVVTKGSQARLIEFKLTIDGEYVYRLRADGVIVATPTGSTAYAMSAQGPILQPTVRAFALVPLNPHVLSARPVSVSDSSVIEIELLNAVDARAHFDGFALTDLQEGDRVVLRRSADSIRFVHPPGYSYFTMLREKLRWSKAVGARLED